LEILGNHSAILATAAKNSVSINKLQPGQQIIAEVIEQLPSKTTTILRIGKQLILAKSDITLTPGQTLKVTVEKSTNEIILRLPSVLQAEKTINTALRQLMPKQAPISEFQTSLIKTLDSLQQHSKTQVTQTAPLGSSLTQFKRISSDIIQTLSINKQITSANGLKVALQNSGILLEAKLLHILSGQKNLTSPTSVPHPNKQLVNITNQQALIRTDLKANLSKLIQLLKSWPKYPANPPQQTTKTSIPAQHQPTQNSSSKQPQQSVIDSLRIENQVKELLNKTEGALAKITLNQLASTNTESHSTRQTWQLEIPLLNAQQTEPIFIKIEKDQQTAQSTKEEKKWTISIEMTPPKLGLIRSKLSLVNNKVSSNFWAENEDTRLLIQQHTESLKKRFQRVDLQTDAIQVQQGTGPTLKEIKPNNNLLNEKA